MKLYDDNYDDDNYDDDELENEDLEEYETEEENDNKKDKKNKKNKTKKSHKTKKSTKKSRGRDKKKVVYRNNDKNTKSGCLSFLLFLIIVALLAVIAYLIYVNYYEEDNNSNASDTSNSDSESSEMCEANTTKFTISSGLSKCSDSTEFKLTVSGTSLSFDITRTGNEDTPYIINSVYYDDVLVSNTGITGISVSDQWELKTDGDVIYLLIINPSSNILTIIDNGQVIYSDNSNTEYNLSNEVTYTKYTELGLMDIDTCENYEANNQLEAEMWTTGKLVYSNGTITAEDEEVINAADVCK